MEIEGFRGSNMYSILLPVEYIYNMTYIGV